MAIRCDPDPHAPTHPLPAPAKLREFLAKHWDAARGVRCDRRTTGNQWATVVETQWDTDDLSEEAAEEIAHAAQGWAEINRTELACRVRVLWQDGRSRTAPTIQFTIAGPPDTRDDLVSEALKSQAASLSLTQRLVSETHAHNLSLARVLMETNQRLTDQMTPMFEIVGKLAAVVRDSESRSAEVARIDSDRRIERARIDAESLKDREVIGLLRQILPHVASRLKLPKSRAQTAEPSDLVAASRDLFNSLIPAQRTTILAMPEELRSLLDTLAAADDPAVVRDSLTALLSHPQSAANLALLDLSSDQEIKAAALFAALDHEGKTGEPGE